MHYSLQKVIPSVQEFPKNLKDGFYEVLRVEYMQEDARKIKNASSVGLAQCGVTDANNTCVNQSYPTPVPITLTGNTTKPIDNVTVAFSNSMTRINSLATDKYLGTEAFASTANSTNVILVKLEEIKQNGTDGNVSCVVSNPLFCEIYIAGNTLDTAVGAITKEIGKFIDGDLVKQFNDYSQYMDYLHGLPYILVLSMVFFTCWFAKDGACCCCGASCIGCLALIPYFVLWLAFFIISSLVVGIGGAYTYYLREVPLDMFAGKPTLAELLEHIQTKFPEFWDTVFAELGEGLEFFWYSAIVFWVFCILIWLYGCCICCCCPYKKHHSKSSSEGK